MADTKTSRSLHLIVHVCVFVHVYKKGVCPRRLLKQTASTKGCVPTPLYGGRVELATPWRKIQACQQQGCCFTAAMATSRHRGTNGTAQLYDYEQEALRKRGEAGGLVEFTEWGREEEVTESSEMDSGLISVRQTNTETLDTSSSLSPSLIPFPSLFSAILPQVSPLIIFQLCLSFGGSCPLSALEEAKKTA
ncbi:hypothetical protein INR49_000480 [Caranx melampygus]|nr:hypothetical protein INR49_000480 [Caranx melampygus]